MSRINFARLSVVLLAFGMPFGVQVARAQVGLLELVPTRASGVEGVDWDLVGGPGEITLWHGGQSVEFDMYISGWGEPDLSTYQASLDCSLFASGYQGFFAPIRLLCVDAAPGEFCQGVDVARQDFVHHGLQAIALCDVNSNCSDGMPGMIRCGGTTLFDDVHDDGGVYYAATFSVDVSPDARGRFTVGLDPDIRHTFVSLADGGSRSPDTIPGVITVVSSGPLAPQAYDLFAWSMETGSIVKDCETDADCRVGLNSDSEVECHFRPMVVGGTCYVRSNRYVALVADMLDMGSQAAMRIRLDLGGGQSHVLGWLGEPEAYVGEPELPPVLSLSRIEPAPYYMDWTTAGPVNVGDCETSPGQTYLIDAIEAGADINDPAQYSNALFLSTVQLFGDVIGSQLMAPPDGVRNFKDISAVVAAFQGMPTEPYARLDLVGGTATPEVPDWLDISFADINAAVSGFQSASYPYASPCDCPGQECP